MKAWYVFPFLAVAIVSALYAGVVRIGWNLPLAGAAGEHGALMVGCFLGTVVFLERTVILQQRFALLLPLINVSGGVFILAGLTHIAFWFLLAGSIGFCLLCLHLVNKYKTLSHYLLFTGAFCLAMGNWLLIKNHFYPQVVPWWMGFFLFTVVAERLELAEFKPANRRPVQLLLLSLMMVFAGMMVPFHWHGDVLFAIAIIAASVWLFVFDFGVRVRTIRREEKYAAIMLAVGFVWLLISGILLLAGPAFAFRYDAVLHCFFIGFVMSMIFAHAPFVLPGVLGLPIINHRPPQVGWYILLQLSLVARIAADSLTMIQLRRYAGLVNGIVILCFFISIAITIRKELRQKKMTAV